jgi:hypothetical protein
MLHDLALIFTRYFGSWRSSWQRALPLGALAGGSLLALLMLASEATAAEPAPFVFRDVAAEFGITPLVKNMHGHAAAWGDANGDGKLDLYVGAFHKDGTMPNRLLLQQDGKFVDAGQKPLEVSARSSGAVFADFDNDGDQDFYLSNLGGGKEGHSATDNKLFRNDAGTFVDVSGVSGACPAGFRGRSAAVLDFNGDGQLDILLGESLAYGSGKRSRLLLNRGDLTFDDATEKVGLPAVPGLGVAAGDVNNDTWPDLLLVASEGGNRLFLNDGGKRVRESEETSKLLQAAWKYGSGDDFTCGACFGDVNRDGLLDMVLGHHFERPWLEPVAVRLYLNRGVKDGQPKFEDVTDAAGLKKLPMKSPHVELQDFDNDGWPDLYVSFVKFAKGRPHPMIFRNGGASSGGVKFTEDVLGVNDFPTADDRATKGTGAFFAKMIKNEQITYTAAAPTADFDGDGRRDILLTSWWTEANAMLLKNETDGGNWLQVKVAAKAGSGINRDGVGTKISVYADESEKKLLGTYEIAVGYGYSSGQDATAHIGLGDAKQVTLVLQPPGEKKAIRVAKATSNERLVVPYP